MAQKTSREYIPEKTSRYNLGTLGPAMAPGLGTKVLVLSKKLLANFTPA